MTTRSITLPDFLTSAQIRECVKIAKIARREHKSIATAVADAVIRPNMQAINGKLGQQNDPMYLAFAVEYVLTSSGQVGDSQ